jgi:ribonuclease BN (tRNA processing enzyme)
MQLAVIGARAGMPAPGEPSSGYVVRANGRAILLDCGPGVAGALPAVAAPEELDAVFISHLHLDHCYDALPIAKMILAPHVPYPGSENGAGTRPVQVPLFLPPGGRSALRTLQGLFPVVTAPMLDHALELAFDMTEYEAATTAVIGGCRVSAVPVRHAVPAWGLRVESPAGVFAYTGDTGWSDTLPELARDADLLLCEATRREPDDGPHGHLSATQAGRLAALAGVSALVLTHLTTREPAWLAGLRADAALACGGPVHLASPGARFDFARPEPRSVPREVPSQ